MTVSIVVSLSHCALTSLQLENKSIIEMDAKWKSLQIYNPYIFMDLKRLLNWLKSKITKIEKNLNETVKYIQISCKKCLTLDVSAIERSVLEG